MITIHHIITLKRCRFNVLWKQRKGELTKLELALTLLILCHNTHVEGQLSPQPGRSTGPFLALGPTENGWSYGLLLSSKHARQAHPDTLPPNPQDPYQ